MADCILFSSAQNGRRSFIFKLRTKRIFTKNIINESCHRLSKVRDYYFFYIRKKVRNTFLCLFNYVFLLEWKYEIVFERPRLFKLKNYCARQIDYYWKHLRFLDHNMYRIQNKTNRKQTLQYRSKSKQNIKYRKRFRATSSLYLLFPFVKFHPITLCWWG